MSRIAYLILLLLLPVTMATAQVERTFYFDFGPNDLINGNMTVSPDENGNYWNNLTDATTSAAPVSLITHDNATSDAYLIVTGSLQTNGIQHGGLLAPDPGLLGDFAISTATQDFFFNNTSGSVTIGGLNPNRGYVFSMFASRNSTEVRKTRYVFTGANICIDTLQTSGTDIGGTGYDGNISTILVSDTIMPDADGNIQISLSLAAGTYCYLNVMKMVELQVDEHYLLDFGPNDVTNGNITPGPDVNGNYWNNPTDPTVSGNKYYLVTKENKATDIYLEVKSAFATNGIQHGGLLDPSAELLGEYAIATATQDYFFTSSSATMEIGGLNPDNGYVFYFFASRNTTQVRWSRYSFTGSGTLLDSLQSSGLDLGGTGYDGNNSTVLITDTVSPNTEGIIYLKLDKAAGDYAYINCMGIDEIKGVFKSTSVLCPEKDNLLIAMMGSSVAYGTGASNNQGYAWMYNELLRQRYNDGEGAQFTMNNISIGGNSTEDLLGRWNSDLLPLCSRYVIYGISLGNEGIHEQGQPMFDQFRDNMLILIDKAREQGIEPLVVNCYTRGDFNATDYTFTKEMNLLIHQWDVASINVLGAVDNGAGRWATGYFYDSWHPNTKGHTEFFLTMVPSLFDALDADKPQPVKAGNTYLTIAQPSDNYQLELVPEAVVHPFTTSFEVKTTGNGDIAAVVLGDNNCVLSIDSNSGCLNYSSPTNGISGTTVLNDGAWHRVTLTHYYARGVSELYVDDVLQGSANEILVPVKFVLSGKSAPTADFREWFFFRAGMNQDEISALCSGAMLKSSLEIYAPLDGEGVSDEEQLLNLAQSTNIITKSEAADFIVLGTDNEKLVPGVLYNCYPNPAEGTLHITFSLPEPAMVDLSVLDISGRVVKKLLGGDLPAGNYNSVWMGECEGGAPVESGYYLSVLKVNGLSEVRGFLFIK